MLTLYVKTGCPWSVRVLEFAQKNNIEFSVMKNRDEAGVRDELIKRGGKGQFPYLVDIESGIEMYESVDIIEYISKKYGISGTVPEPKSKVCILDFDE